MAREGEKIRNFHGNLDVDRAMRLITEIALAKVNREAPLDKD